MRGLQDKVVVITGGARGIGAALCRRFVAEGCRVAIIDILRDEAEALTKGLSRDGTSARAYTADISDHAEVSNTISRIESECGPIDVLVNNAGRNRPTPFANSEPSHWREMIAVNFIGPLNMHHAVIKVMSARNRGRIVNVASDAGRVGSPNEAVYSGCKGGLIAFSKAVAREVAKNNITVNVVCPGPTETQLFRDVAGDGERAQQFRSRFIAATPLGRLGAPEDIGGAVCFLASDDAAFITGQVLSVSGGLTMVD